MTRHHIRHADGPIPPDYAARVRRERESAFIAVLAIILVVITFGSAFL
jgi:hypothetical protein